MLGDDGNTSLSKDLRPSWCPPDRHSRRAYTRKEKSRGSTRSPGRAMTSARDASARGRATPSGRGVVASAVASGSQPAPSPNLERFPHEDRRPAHGAGAAGGSPAGPGLKAGDRSLRQPQRRGHESRESMHDAADALQRGTGMRTALKAAATTAGFTARVAREASALATVAALARRGLGVAIAPSSVSTFADGRLHPIRVVPGAAWSAQPAWAHGGASRPRVDGPGGAGEHRAARPAGASRRAREAPSCTTPRHPPRLPARGPGTSH